jgi:proteasome lid subunit RPN8/RPN11
MNHFPVEISSDGIRETITLFREAGERECVLLWLGRKDGDVQRIAEVYRPVQNSTIDYFEIPREGMAALMQRLREKGLFVVSQVHTHPCEAFHSPTDDRWAILRHIGALSVVLPYFAKSTTLSNFLEQAAVYELNSSNKWIELSPFALKRRLRIEP